MRSRRGAGLVSTAPSRSECEPGLHILFVRSMGRGCRSLRRFFRDALARRKIDQALIREFCLPNGFYSAAPYERLCASG